MSKEKLKKWLLNKKILIPLLVYIALILLGYIRGTFEGWAALKFYLMAVGGLGLLYLFCVSSLIKGKVF